MIPLGARVKEKVSGFTGIVMGRSEYVYGCVRYGIASEQLHDGKPIDWQWFDEGQLEVVDTNAFAEKKEQTGGPSPTPSTGKDPK